MTAPYQARGSNVLVSLGLEETFNTPVTTGTTFYVNSCGVSGTRALAAPPILAGGLHPVAPLAGNYDVAGDLVVPGDLTTLAVLLPFCFPSSKLASAELPSFTLAKHFPDISVNHYYSGCKFSSLKFTVGGGGDLTFSFGVKGAAISATGPVKGTPAAPNIIQHAHATLAEGGAALATGFKLDCNFDFGLDDTQYLIGSGFVRGRMDAGQAAATGNLSCLYTGDTLYTKATAGTESSLALTFTKATATLVLTWGKLVYTIKSPAASTPKGLLLDLDWTAYRALDDPTGTACAITLPTA